MLREGARPEVVRDNMGHANIDVTHIIYGKSWWEARVDAVIRVRLPRWSTDEKSPAVHLLHSGRSLGKHLANALNLSPDAAQFFFDIFVAAIKVVDAVDNGLAVGYQRGEHKRG